MFQASRFSHISFCSSRLEDKFMHVRLRTVCCVFNCVKRHVTTLHNRVVHVECIATCSAMAASVGSTNLHLPTVIFESQHRLSAALTTLLSHISQSNAQPYGNHYLHIDIRHTNNSRISLSQDSDSAFCLKPHRIFLYARYSFSPEAVLFLRPIFVPQVTFRQRKPLSYPSVISERLHEARIRTLEQYKT